MSNGQRDLGRSLRATVAWRRGARLVGHTVRPLLRVLANGSRTPPVLVNSVPKSGTHLLYQIALGAPGFFTMEEFIASTPSLSLREKPAALTATRVQRLLPGEIARAHLFYSEEAARAIEARGAVHLFIVRDPRDVVISEAHYLAFMNRWHRLHRHFRRTSGVEERVRLAIEGISPEPEGADFYFPDVGRRLARFRGWLSHPDTLVVRFEDLRSPRLGAVVAQILEQYQRRGWRPQEDLEVVARKMMAGVNPADSHTFREGVSGGWRNILTPALCDALAARAGSVVGDFGYQLDRPDRVGETVGSL